MSRPFPRFELSEKDCRRFHTQATELLGKALAEYEEHVLIRHRQVDKRRWKTVKNHESLTVYRESRSYAHVSRSLSAEDEESFSRAAGLGPTSTPTRRHSSRSSSSSGGSAGSGSGSGSVSRREKPVVSELELLTGWGPTATEVREQKKRAKGRSISSVNVDLEELPMLLGVGSVIGSLDDVMYGIAAPDCASMALKNAYSHEDVLDGDVLCGIEGPSQRSPFRFLGIKWLVKTTGGTKQRFVSPRDLVYLEATGVITRGDGVRVGYQIMHSVVLAGCPELQESHGIVRSRCEGVHLFVELNDKIVDVYLKAKVTPNGRISESAALQSCAYSLLYCGRTVQCSQNKKIGWRLECNSDKRAVRRDIVAATQCSVCSKSFGRFHRQGGECKLCSAAMCSKCCVERTLKNVETSGNHRHTCKFVTTRVVELCTACIAANNQADTLSVAREEVVSGRFGRIAGGTAIPPGLRRGCSDPGGLTSIATISLEDLPGHEDMAYRSNPATTSSRRVHRPQYVRQGEDNERIRGSRQPEPEIEIDEARDTFDSFGDLIEPIGDLEDVDEMLDTRDMEAVLRRSQHNRNLWQQMVELRDAAENVYQYTKASPAAQMAVGASVRTRRELPNKW
ncbi:hypothetical protein JM18_006491 [Phytophthora kernoviae]|uniref:FYVE-type domain-containing protein n=1 Tax=Phytophthora kernoviae TaxID=325452 RepID=A0A921V5Y9_9STRA|nr:hypothetical protein JM18_006491 [Phytophthora kernoviae]